MEPDKFRKSRLEINHLCEEINTLIDKKSIDVPKAKESFEEVSSCLETLIPQAEGEIQERSVKNLSVKVDALSTQIGKLKSGAKGGQKNPGPVLEWNEKTVSELSPAYLKKVLTNIGEDTDAQICFSTTGKGVRPSYQINYSNSDTKSFSGSSHNPLKRSLSSVAGKTSKPFPSDMVQAIVKKQL